MSKLLIGLSTAALVAASPAMAQTTQDQMKPKPNTEVNRSTSGATTAQPKDATGKQSTEATAARSKTASGEMFRVSKLIGAPVKNANRESIGDINDLIIDGEGKVAKVVVGVGGFLGLGERNVVLKMSELDIGMDKNGSLVVRTSLTKAELEQLPVWKKTDVK
jgi:sporulation protein YlmC with PRC-barrel domain